MMQDLLEMEDVETHKVGADLNVNFGALVWDVGVRPSHKAVILPGTFCSATTRKAFPICVLRLQLLDEQQEKLIPTAQPEDCLA